MSYIEGLVTYRRYEHPVLVCIQFHDDLSLPSNGPVDSLSATSQQEPAMQTLQAINNIAQRYSICVMHTAYSGFQRRCLDSCFRSQVCACGRNNLFAIALTVFTGSGSSTAPVLGETPSGSSFTLSRAIKCKSPLLTLNQQATYNGLVNSYNANLKLLGIYFFIYLLLLFASIYIREL